MPTKANSPAVLSQRTGRLTAADQPVACAWARVARRAGLAMVLGAAGISAQAQVAGAGSSFVRELMGTWSARYGATVGGVTYEAVGSSAGVARASEQSVDFGATDVALTNAALKGAGLRQVPLAAAAVVVMVNLPELGGKPIKLNGDILADIYTGGITQWNHSVIAGNNPDLKLPARAIVPVWRSDGSGQSYAFTTYMSRGNPKWRRSPGATSNLQASVGTGVKGGKAMIDAVKATPGAIGYESLNEAKKAGLVVADLRNADGRWISANAASVTAALNGAKWAADTGAADLDGSSGAAAYPITAVTYALLPVAGKPGRKSALPFVQAAVSLGDADVVAAGFVPLPAVAKNLAR